MANQKDIDSLLELLVLQRATLEHYLEQLAIQGEAYVLPAVKHGIKEARKEIKRLKLSLRQLGVEVNDLPNDEHQAHENSKFSYAPKWIDFVPFLLMLSFFIWGVFIDSIGVFKIEHSIYGIALLSSLIFIYLVSVYVYVRRLIQENWIRVPVIFTPLFIVVVASLFEIWQQGFNTYSIALAFSGGVSLVFAIFKINFSENVRSHKIIRGRKAKEANVLQKILYKLFNIRTLISAILVIIVSLGILYALKLNADLANEFIILVADIDNGTNEPDKFGVTENIINNLRNNLSDVSDVSIEHMDQKITANEGKVVAREEGRKRNATIVIWGWYRAPAQKAQIFVNFELLKTIGPVEKINKETCKGDEIIDANELSSFSIQASVSDEMSYLAISTLGVARFLKDDWEGSFNLFERTYSIAKDYKSPVFDLFHSLAYINMAIKIFYDTNDEDAYLKILSQGIDNGFSLSLTYYLRASAYEDKNQHQLALDDYTKAISLNSTVPCFYNDRGNVYSAFDNRASAIADFTQAISISNDFDFAYYNRGREYFNDSQYDLAISDANKAVNLGLKDARAFSGAAYVEKGQIDLGIEQLKDAAASKGEAVSFAYLYLGLAYDKQGDTANAINSYREVIKINKDSQYIIVAKSEIARLQGESTP